MKMLLFVVAIAAVLFTEHCDAAEWEKFPDGELMFQFNREAKTWSEAKAACEANGGYLAEPSCCVINKYIREKIKSINYDFPLVTGHSSSHQGGLDRSAGNAYSFMAPDSTSASSRGQDWWIGGTDQEKEGQWKWQHSGASIGCFTNWYPDEPNNFGGNQGCLRYWKRGEWDDYYCDKKHPFICQKSSA